MASLHRLVLLLYFLSVLIIKVHKAALTISTLNKISFPHQDLVINCKVGTSPTLTSVYVITLKRNTSNTGKDEDWKLIANVNAGGLEISSQEGTNLATRATVTGKLTPPTSAELVLEIKADEVKCTDAASYQCTLLGAIPSDSSYGEKDEKAVAIEVLPSSTSDIDVSLYSSPNEEMHTYEPGTVVTLTCTGMVGNPARLHRWCKQGVNDPDGFMDLSSTMVVIQELNMTYQPNTCSFQRVSQLKYKITKQDTEIKFMCEDATNSSCGGGLFTKQVTLKIKDSSPSPKVDVYLNEIHIHVTVSPLVIKCECSCYDYALDGAPNNMRGREDTKNTSDTYQNLGRPDEPNNYQALERDQDYENV